jgi:hypothetical protein
MPTDNRQLAEPIEIELTRESVRFFANNKGFDWYLVVLPEGAQIRPGGPFKDLPRASPNWPAGKVCKVIAVDGHAVRLLDDGQIEIWVPCNV